jgi:putative endonuclease
MPQGHACEQEEWNTLHRCDHFRHFAHRNGTGSAFTRKYGVKLLVWYETYDMLADAIQRETTLKHWLRKWKLELIEKFNPNWDDHYEAL